VGGYQAVLPLCPLITNHITVSSPWDGPLESDPCIRGAQGKAIKGPGELQPEACAMATVPDPSPPRTLAYRATRFSIIASKRPCTSATVRALRFRPASFRA